MVSKRPKFIWIKRYWGKILVFLAILATIAIILSAIGFSISGDSPLLAGIIISLVGLGILFWSLRMLSKRRLRLRGIVMTLLISLIFIMFSAAYLDIRSFSDIDDSMVGGFTTSIEALIERVELTFTEVTEDVMGEIGKSTTPFVFVDGGIIVGADGHYITLRNNPNAINPTWSKLKSFLGSDNTDQQTYSYTSFVCADFAEMLHNNAEAVGIRTAYVTIQLGPSDYYPTSGGHALNAFETTDKGLVYIDCTASIDNHEGSDDKVVDVKVGKPYKPDKVFSQGDWYWLSMGVVEEIESIQW